MRASTGVRGILLALFIGPAAAAQTGPIVGTWTTMWLANTPAVIHGWPTTSSAPTGTIRRG
jgi:hypothetical protein